VDQFWAECGRLPHLGRTVTTCRGARGCVSAFKGSALTLGQMADACIYVGGEATNR